MSKFKLEFTLKQHTPIIHFQADKSGATLRATELKPKLDRFLIEHVFENDFEKYKKFLIGWKKPKTEKDKELTEKDFEDKKAFDYKVKIKANSKETSLPNNFLYFANTSVENEQDKKHMVKTTGLEVEFFSYKTELIKNIKCYFDDFLLITNFGARSTKGYGSFAYKTDDIETRLKKYIPIVFKVSEDITQDNWETKVDNIHKKLKAGLNQRANAGQHYKSLLFKYMCERQGGIRWEKRKIKQKFPNVMGVHDKTPIDCSVIDDAKFRYVRAMLGVAGINEYDRGNKTVKIESDEIERFASPITYKVIDNHIYLIGNKNYENIMDKSFKFSYEGNDFDIKTPSPSEFDLYEFLKYVESNENLISEVK